MSYPDADGRVYDASAADAALVQQLALLTGNDRERVERLLHKSALARVEWYLENDAYLLSLLERVVGYKDLA